MEQLILNGADIVKVGIGPGNKKNRRTFCGRIIQRAALFAVTAGNELKCSRSLYYASCGL